MREERVGRPNTPGILDTLLERTPLVDLVEQRVTLRRSGRDRVGLPPFHEQRTPSFTVSPAKPFYHCFGCGAHGNAFQFIQALYHLPFKEAINWRGYPSMGPQTSSKSA